MTHKTIIDMINHLDHLFRMAKDKGNYREMNNHRDALFRTYSTLAHLGDKFQAEFVHCKTIIDNLS